MATISKKTSPQNIMEQANAYQNNDTIEVLGAREHN
jgi:hypothetical protein